MTMHSLSNLYVVVANGISASEVFTSKIEALADAERANSQPSILGMRVEFKVLDLEDYITSVRDKAYDEGYNQNG